MGKWIAGGVLLLFALFVLFVVLPIRRAFRYFEDEDASGSDEYGI